MNLQKLKLILDPLIEFIIHVVTFHLNSFPKLLAKCCHLSARWRTNAYFLHPKQKTSSRKWRWTWKNWFSFHLEDFSNRGFPTVFIRDSSSLSQWQGCYWQFKPAIQDSKIGKGAACWLVGAVFPLQAVALPCVAAAAASRLTTVLKLNIQQNIYQ